MAIIAFTAQFLRRRSEHFASPGLRHESFNFFTFTALNRTMTIFALLIVLACFATFVASTIVALTNQKFRIVASLFALLAFCGGTATVGAFVLAVASM